MPDIQSDPAFEEFISVEGDEPQMLVDHESFRTIDLRDPLEFEDDLLSDIAGPTDQRGGRGASIPVKGRWVHGWLESMGDDYINNIYKNWLHFTTYVRARTKQFIGTTEFSLRQGNYENMFRYILVLEELGLVSRGRSETVDQSEYDHFVPERMRQRRYVSIDTPFNEEPEAWTRPHNALYGDGEDSDDESEDVEIDIDEPEEEQPQPETEPGGSLDSFRPTGDVPEQDDVPDTTQADDEVTEDEDQSEGSEIPDVASIDDYPRLQEIRSTVTREFQQASESAFQTATIDYEEILPTDYSLGRFLIIGVWVSGEATPRRDVLEVMMTVDDELAEMSPGFLPGAIGSQYRSIILDDFDDWFSDVNVTSVYEEGFEDTLSLAMAGEEEKNYYDVLAGRFNSID